MELITSVTVGAGGAASVTLPATGTIPATYTDLKVIVSARTNRALVVDGIVMRFNGDTTSGNYTAKRLYGNGSSAASDSPNNGMPFMNGNTSTASTFGNAEIYIPNYAGSNAKSSSVDGVNENNATEAYAGLYAFLWSGTAAITTITITSETSATILEGSTFYLYGISNVTSTTKATGGIVSSDGTYNYHMFPFSGTFTPIENITADYLIVAGGGGGGSSGTPGGGGGGAGGYRYFTSQSLSATSYSVTVGAGGPGGFYNANTGSSYIATKGNNSTFNSTSSTGGGFGGTYPVSTYVGGPGGSGGGGTIGTVGGAGNEGSYSPVEGYAGGTANGDQQGAGGGGGGAVGQSTTGLSKGGDGGIGISNSAFANATQTGVNGYYAGGGGGGGGYLNINAPGAGGLGGGGNGGAGNTNPSLAVAGFNGTANTGGGGGGSGGDTNAGGYPPGLVGGTGGSGVVIIRYAI